MGGIIVILFYALIVVGVPSLLGVLFEFDPFFLIILFLVLSVIGLENKDNGVDS